ncbi:hypothetical protein APHAL10511_002510 [Amanita phalloides]|nr:hypothetical protein APHAL10511_002510 [Amanita phalloides]
MSTPQNQDDHWLNMRARSSRARSMDGDEYTPHSMSIITQRPTSSLAGAMGESSMSPARDSQAPTLIWDTAQTPLTAYYPNGSRSPSTNLNFSSRHHSPESLLSVSSSGSPQQYPVTSPHSTDSFLHSVGAAVVSFDQTPFCDEVVFLRERVRQLEQECRRAALIDRTRGYIRPAHSPSFQAGWDARTEARKKIFCSLNRAGNALCAWHDSRRERRKHAPRNAPPGKLNCDCTFEEALFEESLSRHGVSSYHPGEAVRMDPALRNPLLKLLERRYGYRDGDFDLDPISGTWSEGQSPDDWKRRSSEGRATRARS